MKILLFLMFLCASLHAQISLSANSLSFTQTARFVGPPYPQKIDIGGSGDLTIGTIVGAPYNFSSSINAHLCQVAGTSQCIPTAVAPATLWISWSGYGNGLLLTGSYVGTIPIISLAGCSGNCTLTVNLNVLPYSGTTFAYAGGLGYPKFCSNSSSVYLDPDSCVIPSTAAGTFLMPPAGSSYVDGNLGGTVDIITNPLGPQNYRTLCGDAVVSSINSNNSLICNSGLGGESFITSIPAGVDSYHSFPLSDGGTTGCWDSHDPNTFYPVIGMSVHKITLVSPPSTWTNSIIYTYTGNATHISSGGDGECSKDDWTTLFTAGGTDRVMIVVNLHNPSQVFTRNVGPDFDQFSNFFFRAMMISPGINASNNSRYIIIGGQYNPTATPNLFSAQLVYTVSAATGAIAFVGPMPQTSQAQRNSGHQSYGTPCDAFANLQQTGSPNCYMAAHQALAEVSGVEYLIIASAGTPGGYNTTAQAIRLDKGLSLMGVNQDAGGGMYMANWISNVSDIHLAAARTGPYVIVSANSVNVPTAFAITNVTTGPNFTVTSSTPYTGANGDIIAIGGVRDMTGVNGLCTVAGLSGNTLQCAEATSIGTFVQIKGAFVKSTTATVGPHINEVFMWDLSQVAFGKSTIHRIATSRDQSINGGHLDSNYFGQSHAVISQDGTLSCWQWNNYVPENNGIACAATGANAVPAQPSAPTALTISALFVKQVVVTITLNGTIIPQTLWVRSGY